MQKNLSKVIFFILFLCFAVLMAQEAENTTSGSGIDWFQLTVMVGYLVGVFILLPIVIYTNLKSKLFSADVDGNDKISIVTGMSEEDRNSRASLILEKIEEKLTTFQNEDGDDMVTITKGSQAKFMKAGLDYINQNLVPTDSHVIERIEEFTAVYEDRTKRAFTGSNWIIGCSIATGVLFLLSGGISTFIFIHFLGLLFYILSSRTTFYGIEKRMKTFGGKGGTAGRIMSILFLGNATKYYVKESGQSSWKRDYETEGQMALIGLVFLIMIAFLLGIFAAFLGIINFIINYSTSFLIPFKKDDDWYQKNFS